MARVNHEEIGRLVDVIDEDGTGLSRTEIDFIAGIIDGGQVEFSEAEARRVNRIYYRRVVNGKPEND